MADPGAAPCPKTARDAEARRDAPVAADGVASAATICAARNRRFLLAASVLASALGFIDGSVVAIAMPAMRESLQATLPQAQWISNAYMLTLSALILVGGAFADRLGLVRVFAGGIGVFVAASLVCTVATSPQVMIAARAVQGMGAALMVPGSLALIARAYPPAERGRAIGVWAAASAVTTAGGPLIGGAALSLGGPEVWRALFAVNLPLGALALWLLLRHAERETERAARGIDVAGAVLVTAGLGLLAAALTGQSEGHGAMTGAPWFAAAGAALLAAFLVVEARSPHPMMPLALFRSATFSAANGLTFLLYFALSANLFYLPMTVIAGWGLSAFAAGTAFLPLTIAVAGLSQPVGALADRIGPRLPIAAGAGLVAAAYAGLAALAPLEAYWSVVLPAMAAMGLGMGMVVAPLSTAVMGAVPEAATGTASGVNNALSRIAGLVAIAAMGALVAARYSAEGGTASFGAPAPDVEGHRAAMTAAFATLAWVNAALAAGAAAVALIAIPPGKVRPEIAQPAL